MKKVFLAVMLAFVTASLSFAQISTGDPTATKIKTGNRPQAGTFGLYGGAEVLLHGNEPYLLPVINLKYFLSDRLELRAGLDIYSSSFSFSGKRIGADVYDDDKQLYTQKGGGSEFVPMENHFTISPGFAYHFSNSNILDVYVGAELPLGVRTYSSRDIVSGDNAPGGEASLEVTSSPFHIGLNGVIGLQAFIGNLPLAVGFEYGIGLQADLGNKYKVVSVAGDNKATYYVQAGAMQYDPMEDVYVLNLAAADKFANLSVARATLDHFFRLTLSYYFK